MRLNYFTSLFLCLAFSVFVSSFNFKAYAQNEDVLLSDSPLCSTIENDNEYSVYGTIASKYYTLPNGEQTRHYENFKLGPSTQLEFCSTGPFYEGYRVQLSLRTLIPVFECHTQLGKPIKIIMEKNDEGDTVTYATCY